MANNVYPDFSNSKFDIPYIKALMLSSDLSNTTSTPGSFTGKIGETIVDDSPDVTIVDLDGGFASAIYSITQNVDRRVS